MVKVTSRAESSWKLFSSSPSSSQLGSGSSLVDIHSQESKKVMRVKTALIQNCFEFCWLPTTVIHVMWFLPQFVHRFWAIFGRRYIVIGESCLIMLLFWALIIQSQADELHTSSNVFRSSNRYIPFSFGVGRALCPFPSPSGTSGTEITTTNLTEDFEF